MVQKRFFRETGICYQDDIFWSTLSVKANIDLFGMIKGVPENMREKWMKVMDLDNFKHTTAK